MEAPAYFRVFFWQKIRTMFSLPVIVAMLIYAPFSNGWPLATWVFVGVIITVAYTWYLVQTWRRSDVVLDDEGVTLFHEGSWQSWPYAALNDVRRSGRFRVRMYFNMGQEDRERVPTDLLNADDFVDELLDRYEASQGHPLPDEGSTPAAAA
jgi:hypothetical protein